jgi:hypothetical protein
MVKAIADQEKIHTPTFLGFIFKFTLPFLLPILIVVWWLFFKNKFVFTWLTLGTGNEKFVPFVFPFHRNNPDVTEL